MLPPQLSTTHGALPSTVHTLRHSPRLSALILVSTRYVQPLCLAQQYREQRRGCFFGRRRVWSSYLDPSFQRHLEKRRKALKHRYIESLHRKSLWDREHNRRAWSGWRISSLWGFPPKADGEAEPRPRGNWTNLDRSETQKNDGEEHPGFETREEQMQRRVEEIRRQVEEDPFKALFGYRMRNLRQYDSSSTSTGEELQNLLNLGRKGCTDIISRLNANRGFGRDGLDGVEETYRATENMSSGSRKVKTDRVKAAESKDPVERALNEYTPTQATAADDEFEYDPITMRKVPKKSKEKADPVDSALKSYDQSVDIPVKTFKGYHAEFDISPKANPKPDLAKQELAKYTPPPAEKPANPSLPEKPQESVESELSKYKAKYSWLEREGFVEKGKTLRGKPTISEHLDTEVTSPAPMAIPRVRAFEIPAEPPSENYVAAAKPSQLQYDFSEPKTEDLDLLRASDVRSSTGILKSRNVNPEVERQQSRKKLEEEFEKPRGLKTSYAEEVESMKVLQRKKGTSKATTEGDGYSTEPKGLRASYDREVGEQWARVQDGEGDAYGQTPQGLETCYDREVKKQRALMQEAEADGYSMTPQDLQASYARRLEAEQEKDAYDKTPQGLETLFAREVQTGKSQENVSERPIPWKELSEEDQQLVLYSELDKYRSDGTESVATEQSNTAQVLNDHPKRTPPQPWSKRSVKKVAKAAQKKKYQALTAEVRRIYGDVCGVIDTTHRMQLPQVESVEKAQPDMVIDEALEDYEKQLGPNSYKFPGGDGQEAEILLKPQPEKSQTGEPRPAAKCWDFEEQAMRLEEQEQTLHEELRETNDFLHEVHSEFEAIKAKAASTSTRSQPIVFKILAYDPSADQVTGGTTTYSTSSSEHKILSPSEAIPRLSHPAKFLPYLTAFKREGYEIVSGASDVLVFRKVRDESSAAFEEEDDEAPYMSLDEPLLARASYYGPVNPIDGTTTGNFASPTGFVNHDAIFSTPHPEVSEPALKPARRAAATASRVVNPLATDKVTREEPVFSGQRRPWADSGTSSSSGTSNAGAKPKEGRKKTIRRVFWVGVWVAGCSYAVGVMKEFFTTGGVDGKGVQWFSGFNKDP